MLKGPFILEPLATGLGALRLFGWVKEAEIARNFVGAA
jgi:hypothetical protein